MQYPMVTDVGSELGRPDDGTDPTGFFNDEFYVGLKPYNDASWKTGSIHNKAELQADIQKHLEAFPGVIFNYTQPAEDAVDEALTGLKSALAVKIYGPDLNVLQSTALEIKRRLSQVPGFTELTVVRELGQPSLIIDVDRDKIARYGINVADVEAIVQAAVGGQAATQVIQGEKLFDLVVRMKPEFRENAHADRQPAGGHARGPADSPERARQYSRGERRILHLSREQFALHRRAVQRRRARPAERGGCRPAGHCRHSEVAARGLPARPGAANTANSSPPGTRWNSSARSRCSSFS